MTTASGRDPITFINVFDIPGDEVDAFIDEWQRRSRLIIEADGFISAELHRATDSDTQFQLINVSKWESRAAFENATHAPEYRRQLDGYAAAPTSTWIPHRGIYQTAVKLD